MTIVIGHHDVLAASDMSELVAACRQGFLEEARGELIQPARLNVPVPGGYFRIMPVVMNGSGLMGMKVFHGNKAAGIRYLISVYDKTSGELLALVDGHYLTAARTGATAGVAADHLARPDAGTVAIIGSGLEARTNFDAMCAVRDVSSVRIFSPRAERREQLAAEIAAERGIIAEAFDSAAGCVRGADIVIVATNTMNAPDPIAFRGKWIEAGMHVSSIGSTIPALRELDTETFANSDLLAVDSAEQVLDESGDAIAAVAEGVYPDAVSLADIVGGNHPGRVSADDRTLFKSVGTAVQDVASAFAVYQRVLRNGGGHDVGDFLDRKEVP